MGNFALFSVACLVLQKYAFADHFTSPEDFQDAATTRVIRDIKLAEANRQHTRLNTRKMNNFLDDDMILDAKQANMIKQQYVSRGSMRFRGKRKAMDFDFMADYKWTLFPIRIKWDDDLNDDSNPENAAARQAVRDALQIIEDKSCIRFLEVASEVPVEAHHIMFSRGTSCTSTTGKFAQIPQPVFFATRCFNEIGEILHHMLHVLGFWHEHQRPDRDSFVTVNNDNVEPGEEGTFSTIDPPVLETRGLHYDYESVTHYHTMYHSKNGNPTIQTKDPLYKNSIGQRAKVSFLDAKLLNMIYNCAGQLCTTNITCANEGYQDPNNCRECVCPEGYGGSTCEDMEQSASGCGGSLVATGNTQFITSPNYPNAYDEDTTCVWKITSNNPNKKVRMAFWGNFTLHCVDKACHHYIEIRYKEPLYSLGPKFCCDEPALTGELESESDEVLVIFKSHYSGTSAGTRVGFKLGYYIDDPCVNTICQNGGTCQADDGTCKCHAEYTGSNCETAIDSCAGINCQNGGICRNGACSCRPGYTGNKCQTNIDDCGSNPCRNGGTCRDKVNAYQCNCKFGWTGSQCQTDVNECASNPCMNRGTCINGANKYTCNCRPGYTGTRCQTNRNECLSNPCKNGGTCRDGANSYICVCKPGFSGITCQNDATTPCSPIPCQNGGTCTVNGLEHTCDCAAGFMGDNCQTPVNTNNPCDPNPCRNGGTCVRSGSTYTCQCRGGLYGNQCEKGNCGGCSGEPGPNYEPCKAVAEPVQYYTQYKIVATTTRGFWNRKTTKYKMVAQRVKRTELFCCDVAEEVTLASIRQYKCGVKGWSAWGTCHPVNNVNQCCKQQSHRWGMTTYKTSRGDEDGFTICETKLRYCSTKYGGCNMYAPSCSRCDPCY